MEYAPHRSVKYIPNIFTDSGFKITCVFRGGCGGCFLFVSSETSVKSVM